MDSTRLSSKGQVIIPKSLRDAYQWQPGQEFTVTDIGEGILLQPKRPFAPTTLADVAGSLPYGGPPKSVDEMAQAIARGVQASRGEQQADDHT
jgi:AbrB family looped-hinge helix DNA binding protein